MAAAKRQNPVKAIANRIMQGMATVDSTMMARMPEDFQRMFKKDKKTAPKPKEKP